MSWYGDISNLITNGWNEITDAIDPRTPYEMQAEANREARDRYYAEAEKQRQYQEAAGQAAKDYINQGNAQQYSQYDSLYAPDGYTYLPDGSYIDNATLDAYLANPEKYINETRSLQEQEQKAAAANKASAPYDLSGMSDAEKAAATANGTAKRLPTRGAPSTTPMSVMSLGARLGSMNPALLARARQQSGAGNTIENFYKSQTAKDAPTYIEQLYLDRKAGKGYDPYAQRMLEQGYGKLNQQMNARGGFNSGAAMASLGNYTSGVNAALYQQNADLAQAASSSYMGRQVWLGGLAQMAQNAATGRAAAYAGINNDTSTKLADITTRTAGIAGGLYNQNTSAGINAGNAAGANEASGMKALQGGLWDGLKSLASYWAQSGGGGSGTSGSGASNNTYGAGSNGGGDDVLYPGGT